MNHLTLVLSMLSLAAAGPPDPRQGDRLDGREPPPADAEAALGPPRLLLSPVRAAAYVVLTPIDRSVGFLERHKVYDHLHEALTSDDRLLGVRPIVRYQSETAVAGGLRVYDRRTLGPGSLLAASMQAGLRAREGSLTFEPPGRADLGLELEYGWRSDALYGGGAGRPRDEQAALGQPVVRYGVERYAASSWYKVPLGQPLRLRLGLGFDRRRYGDGTASGTDPAIQDGALDPATVPGFIDGLQIGRASIELRLDGRRHPRFGSGPLAGFTGAYAHGLGRDGSRHLAARAGAGVIVAFGDRALGGGLRAGLVQPVGDAPVPFEELLSPTGHAGLRGLSLGRLRGRSELVATLEYRWLLAAWLDAILFVDRGNVYGPGFEDLALERAFTSLGLGLVAFDMDQIAYWASPPRFGLQLAVTPDDGLRLSFALHAW